MYRLLILILVFVAVLKTQAQKIPLVNYEKSPLQVNPALMGFSSVASFNFYNRIQQIQSGPQFTTSALTGILPLLNRRKDGHLGSLGVSFLSDELSPRNLIREESLGFSLAYKVRIAPDWSLGTGLSWTVLQRFFDAGGFTTGSQYVIGKGFDPTLAVNEDFKDISGGYSTCNSGVLLLQSYPNDRPRFFLGASLGNINRPTYTSYTENDARLNYQYGLQLGYNWRLKDNLHLLTDGDLRFMDDEEWLNFGVTMNYSWDQGGSSWFKTGSVSLIPRYVVGRVYAVAFEFAHPFLSLRIGRSMNTSKIHSTYMSGNEIMLSLHKSFGVKKPRRLVRRVQKAKRLLRKKKEEFLWEDVYWDYTRVDSHAILDEKLKKFVDSLVDYLNRHKKAIVHIYVYTDLLDNDAKNLEVSVHRAEVVSRYFQEMGIEPNRLDYYGRGNSQPLVPNAFGQDRLQNRRIKFVIYR